MSEPKFTPGPWKALLRADLEIRQTTNFDRALAALAKARGEGGS